MHRHPFHSTVHSLILTERHSSNFRRKRMMKNFLESCCEMEIFFPQKQLSSTHSCQVANLPLLWRQRPAKLCLLTVLLLLLSEAASVTADSGTAATTTSPRLLKIEEFEEIIKDLRQGDYRLVRPNPSEETTEKQAHYCGFQLPSFILTLLSRNEEQGVVGKK